MSNTATERAFRASAGRESGRSSDQSGAATRYSGGVETLFSVTQVAISVVVIFLVLMHSGKDSGLSGAFGVGSGTGPLGGGSMVERNLNRWTIAFAILFVINAIILLKRPWA
jgi:preprotein translocase subunit SecG